MKTKAYDQRFLLYSFLGHILLLGALLYIGWCPLSPLNRSVSLDIRYSEMAERAAAIESANQIKQMASAPKSIERSTSAVEPAANSTSIVPGLRLTRWPRILREEKAQYPHEAKAKGIEGDVTLKVLINKFGVPEKIEVIQGPGHGLNEAAEQAMRMFKFAPAFENDQPVATEIIYKYKFSIRK